MEVKILKFYSDTCVPCKTLTKMLEGHELPIKAINIAEDPESTIKYHIRKVPVLVYIDENGDEIIRNSGIVPPEVIKNTLDELQRDSEN